MTWRFEALHPALALPRRAMRVSTPVIEVSALPMFYPRHHLALGRDVAFQLVRDRHPRHVLQTFEQLLEELLRRLLVAPLLHQDIEDIVILIHCPPQVIRSPLIVKNTSSRYQLSPG